jgi:hypothetical protein
MTTPWSIEALGQLERDPKIEILHMIKGSRAVTIMSNVLFPEDLEGRHEWSTKFSLRTKRRALLIIYARTKRVNRDIIFSLLTGETSDTGNTTGQSFTYKKGMKVIEEVM